MAEEEREQEIEGWGGGFKGVGTRGVRWLGISNEREIKRGTEYGKMQLDGYKERRAVMTRSV